MSNVFDLIIVGGGPAGLTASIYAERAKLKTLLIEKLAPGGQIALTDAMENYPGFPEIGGQDLANLMEAHARKLGVDIINSQVLQIVDKGSTKTVKTTEEDYVTRSVIVASGTQPKRLGVKGEENLIGRGVSFCAVCDGRFFQNKDVCVVGGGNSAVQEALFLSRLARKVYMIHRRAQLRAEKVTQERALSNPKIELVWDSVVEEIIGNERVEAVIVRNVKDEKKRKLDVNGVFLYAGNSPNTEFIDVKKDENKFIVTNENLETSMRGVFAAGDCRAKLLRQVATAVGDGALAAFLAERYIEESKEH
ncbi:MAG: thioredoxin-disulfide reductase [Candidatus Atabeyarchaeum deiterrae]